MCVGHPKTHPCQHMSLTFNHCVGARFDSDARRTTPCANTTYAAPVETEARCTSQLCFFEQLGGSWMCCQCKQGPNFVGWCNFPNPRTEINALTGQPEHLRMCDHGCCWNCVAFLDAVKESSSRGGPSGHRRHHHGSSRRGPGGSSSQGPGGSSSQGGSSSSQAQAGSSQQNYRWAETGYASRDGSSSSHGKRRA